MNKEKYKIKTSKERKENEQILLMIFIIPLIAFAIDMTNTGHYFFPWIDNLTNKYDILSFIGAYTGAIVSAIFLLLITQKDRKENNEILRQSQRPYLEISWSIIDKEFIDEKKFDINRKIFFYELLGGDKYTRGKEFLSLEIHNTGASVAIIDINNSKFTFRYKEYHGTIDGKDNYEDRNQIVEMSSVTKRKSIAAGDSIFIVIDSILLYDSKNWRLYEDICIENTEFVYKDLFNCQYKDICNYENGKIIPQSDNEII